jgi:uncharacterized protein (TIGR02646 family)
MYQRGQPKWKRLPSNIKQELHKVLIAEQGEICCYCGGRVSSQNSHIEHFRPKRKGKYPKLQLEYTNLLCSCQRELQKEEPKHCGNAKKSWFDENLTISPLELECECRFEYLENGQIRPASRDDEGALKTIKHLALDIDKLRELRKPAIEAALDTINISDTNEIKAQIEIYSHINPKRNCLQPYCAAIIDVLERLL